MPKKKPITIKTPEPKAEDKKKTRFVTTSRITIEKLDFIKANLKLDKDKLCEKFAEKFYPEKPPSEAGVVRDKFGYLYKHVANGDW